MTEHKSFRVTNFSIRDVPALVVGYLIVAAIAACIGLFLEAIPEFWRGFLLGVGATLIAAFLLLGPRPKKIKVSDLPQPSEAVRAKCADLDCPLVEVVKAYRDETGLGLTEAKAVVDSYRARVRSLEQDDTMT